MTRERLHQIVDLILLCEKWGFKHRAELTVDNAGCHEVRVYPYVNQQRVESHTTIYEANPTVYMQDPNYITDPNFDRAEAHIRRLLDEIVVEDEDGEDT